MNAFNTKAASKCSLLKMPTSNRKWLFTSDFMEKYAIINDAV